MTARAPIVDDIHRLARAYHWAERDVLALPLPRRAAYLARIEGDEDAAVVAALVGGG